MRRVALWGGPLLGAATYGLCAGAGLASPACWAAAVTTLCAIWWVTEPIPVPATSLLPFAIFPLAGVMSHREVALAMGDSLILLLLCGFILSTGIEKSGAHRRIALWMVRALGGGHARRLVLGFMLTTAFISMWISNTATTMMLLPVALAVARQEGGKLVAGPLVLGIAWAASIGGMATPIGTPPNIVFLSFFRRLTGHEISFFDWMSLGLPIVCLLLPVAWWLLTRGIPRGTRVAAVEALGPWRPAEKRVAAIFALTALLWVTRTVPFGGWSGLLELRGVLGDSTVALFAVLAMFLLPSGEHDEARLLDWKTASQVPWGYVLLIGGGLALAKGFEQSGLSASAASLLTGLSGLPVVVMLLALCGLVAFLSEISGNTALVTMLMPILASVAVGMHLDPILLMAPATLAASCGFMLPVATPPNALAYGTGFVDSLWMARNGFWLNVAGIGVIGVYSWLRLA